MKYHPAYTAVIIWFRGHIAFFIFGLILGGPLVIFTSLAALLASLPALIIYIPLCMAATFFRPLWARFAFLLVTTLLVTYFSASIAQHSGESGLGGDDDNMLISYGALASTFLSMISAGYLLRDAGPESNPATAQ